MANEGESPWTRLVYFIPQRSTWALNECLNGHKGTRNPVLSQGWASYPWATARIAGSRPSGTGKASASGTGTSSASAP